MLEIFLCSLLLGGLAGLLAGLFGLGGGVVIVPTLLGLFSAQQFSNEHIMIMAIATSLATIILTSISSIITHHRLGTILWSRAWRLIPGIILGAGIGGVVAGLIDTEILKWFFIVYLCYVAFRMSKQATASKGSKHTFTWLDYVVGGGIGFLSTLLGIGGGTLTVPYLHSRKILMKNAVAVSSVCGLPIAISGSITYILLGWHQTVLPEWSLGYIYLPAFFGIITCSLFTAQIGAKLAVKLPTDKLKRYFSWVIFLLAIKMALS